MQLINYTQVGERGRNVVVVLQFAAVALKYAFPINCAMGTGAAVEKSVKRDFSVVADMNRSYKRRFNAATAHGGIGPLGNS